jgi:Beta-lactamase enzyme family
VLTNLSSDSSRKTKATAQLNEQSHTIDEATTHRFLIDRGYLPQVQAWQVLFAAVEVTNKPYRELYWQSRYQDSNNNETMDAGDHGFFNPASTIKTAVAALTLEWLASHGIPRSASYRTEGSESFVIEEDLRAMQVISDNPATNRLIMLLGFDFIDAALRAKGITDFSIERLMLDGGTLVPSPAHFLTLGGQNWVFPAKAATRPSRCEEFPGRPGNGASMAALLGVMMRLTNPDDWGQHAFHLRKEDRDFLLTAMARTPEEQDFPYHDTWNRFIHSEKDRLVGPQGKLISKGGVALWSKTWTDQSYLLRDDGRKIHLIITVRPPEEVQQSEAFPWMARLALDLVDLLAREQTVVAQQRQT